MSVKVILKNVCRATGEGPHWDEKTKELLYVDINVGDVHRWNSVTGEDIVKHIADKNVGFVVPRSKGGYVIGLDKQLASFTWDSDIIDMFHEVDKGKHTRLNDGKCDPTGRLWAGTMGIETAPAVLDHNQGSLFRLGTDMTLTTQMSDITVSNGLAWTADKKTMFYIDSVPPTVYAFDYDNNDGTISNKRIAFTYASEDMIPVRGYPDGCCMDQQGKLWIAGFKSGQVFRFDTETGKMVQSIKIPGAKHITSCCFGGENYDVLYVTTGACVVSAAERQTEEMNHTGSIYAVTGLGVKGTPGDSFEG